MILGVAQVVVNAADVTALGEELAAAGYELSFHERRLANNPAKAPFQSVTREALEMTHHKAPGGAMAIEITAYAGAPPAGETAFRLVLDDADRTVSHVVATSPDAAAATRFWTALGFKPDAPDRLRFEAMMPAWRLELRLEPGGGVAERATVDADGCVLVTMLSTDVDADTARLAREAGSLRYAGPWAEQVGGRMLRAAVLEGPGGELVELIQLPRDRDEATP